MDFALTLSLIAAGGHFWAAWLYNQRIFRREIVPNSATWLMWVILTVIGVLTYGVMTGDRAKWIPSLACALATAGTFIYCRYTGKFERIPMRHWPAMALGATSLFVWWWSGSATYANFFSVGATASAFIPIYMDVWKKPSLEKPLPWFVWTIVYALIAIVVILHWRDQPQDLMYPLLMFFMHPVVALLSLRKPRVLIKA